MKATNHASRSKRKKNSSPPAYTATSSSRLETGIFATLGLVGLVAVVIAFASAFAPADAGLREYVRSGRFAADARTWAAMVRYILEPEPGAVTNVIESAPPQKNLPSPTNLHNSGPRV